MKLQGPGTFPVTSLPCMSFCQLSVPGQNGTAVNYLLEFLLIAAKIEIVRSSKDDLSRDGPRVLYSWTVGRR